MISLDVKVSHQPDDVSCGPTCLQGVYAFHGLAYDLDRLREEIPQVWGGGTMAVLLARHAQLQGLGATIYTCNLKMFDPTWFELPASELPGKLRAQSKVKRDRKTRTATKAYLQFLRDGGTVEMRDPTLDLIAAPLQAGLPVIAGLCSTWLYGDPREHPGTTVDDDIGGIPTGHFVVICGIDVEKRRMLVADPWPWQPFSDEKYYIADADRVIASILLGITTHDAKLLVIHPRNHPDWRAYIDDSHRHGHP